MSEETEGRPSGVGALLGRLALAHFLSYLLLFLAAFAVMSLAIVLQKDELMEAGRTTIPGSDFQRWLIARLHMGTGDAAAFEMVMIPVAVVLGALFVLTHATSVPWALAARRHARGEADEQALRKGRNFWIVTSLGVTAIVLVAGLVGWVLILTSPTI